MFGRSGRHSSVLFTDLEDIGVLLVKLALKRNKRLHIVHYDWFEFSTVAEKRLPEREFSMRNFQAKQRAKERERAKIEKGKRDGEKFVNTSMSPLSTRELCTSDC